jgi:hypothetical protein
MLTQVLAPYDAEDARGLMKAAIRDPDPVVYLVRARTIRVVQAGRLSGATGTLPRGCVSASAGERASPCADVLGTRSLVPLRACATPGQHHRRRSDLRHWLHLCNTRATPQENELLYGTAFPVSAEVLGKDFVLPIGKAKVQRAGTDVTMIAFGKMVGYNLQVGGARSGVARRACRERRACNHSRACIIPYTLNPLHGRSPRSSLPTASAARSST